jgi:hypothetical protein
MGAVARSSVPARWRKKKENEEVTGRRRRADA